ncbi:putative endochitinase [Neoconidiobolus thromboides FSU 785]|nr:putative endochitinase [Neoconidiobolus thromboides FSU 785]
MVSSENGRNEFVNSVIDLIQQYGFDFIDLDWEFPVRGFPQMGVKGNPDDADYMLQLLKQFSQQFQSQLKFNCFITIALPSPEYYLSQYDINSIDPYIEYYNAMTYDFSGTFSATANFASNLYTNGTGLAVDESIKRMIKAGIPSDKLLMGIPAYATTFRDCKENKFPTTYNKDSTLKIGENGYIPINKVDWSKVDQQWNDELKANYGYFKDYNMLLSYDSIKSVTEKVNYIKDNKLKGVMVWALHQDFPVSDQRSLVSNSVNLLGQDNLENSQNNINYPNSKFENVKDSNFKVTVTSNSLILFSSNLFTYIFLVVLIFN